MTLETRIYDGDRAREVVENEQFVAAFSSIEKDLITSWRSLPSTPANTAARERIHLSLTLLGKVKACLEATLADGKLAMQELQRKRSIAERARDAKRSFVSDY